MKDTRQLLKDAREAIKNKDYESSMTLSKSVLRHDKSNYMALVFYGISLQELGPADEAPKVFRKAIAGSPTNPLAWAGLISYYEKFDRVEDKKELIECYSKVLRLGTLGEDKKVLEYCEKLSRLVGYGQIVEGTNTVYACRGKFESIRSELSKVIVVMCEKYFEKLPEVQPILEECLLDLINNENDDNSNPYYSLYINLLYTQKRYKDLLQYAEKMRLLFETDTIPLVWVCKVYNQLYVEGHETAEKFYKAKEYFNKILDTEPTNAIALFTKSIMLYAIDKVVESKDILLEITTARPGLVHAWIFLTKACIRLQLYEEAAKAASKASKLLKAFGANDSLKDVLDELSMEFLAKSGDAQDSETVLEIYKMMSNEDLKVKCLKYVILANLNLKRFDEANSLSLELKELDMKTYTLLLAKQLHVKGEYRNALTELEKDPCDSSEWWTEIGILHWKLGENQKCLVPLLKAAKKDQNNYIAYLYLGHYYNKLEQTEKAKRCYEKAFNINPKSKEVGMELNKIYRKDKNWEASENVLQTFTEEGQAGSWTWLNLGLGYLEKGDYTMAIDNLQKAVRVERDNPKHCWEALADAYLSRGSYTSALKCYNICLELTENKLYPSLQIANIKKILGEYVDARADFEKLIISPDSQYVPILKGFAETCLLQARECHDFQQFRRSWEHAQLAAHKLTLAIKQKPRFSCLWKLLGDVCLFVTKLPEHTCCLFLPNDFIDENGSDKEKCLERDDLYNLANKIYCKAIGLTKDNLLYWHDLGTCYLSQALIVDDVEKKKVLLSYAMAVASYCTENDPNGWRYWNLMGTVAMRQDPPNYALAQHAFIKAVSLDKNCSVSWSNLGTLYLILNNIRLSNSAYAQGQRSDLKFVNNWIGQAMIAETISNEEGMDLLRHSIQLGQHPQGSLGYAYWVCRALKESSPGSDTIEYIQKMHSIPVACDALTWYIKKNLYDPCAWNMLGILSERMGLGDRTLEAYGKAYKLSLEETQDLARVNYGRALFKSGKYSEAIDLFQEVKEATFSSGTGLALALFKDGQYEGAYSAYEQVLHWLTEQQNCQSDLLVALASIAYMFQGVDPAKTLLFQSIQLKPTSPWSLYATFALALIHQDIKLAELVLEEMKGLRQDKECVAQYSRLLSYYYLTQKAPVKAISAISKLVHHFPNNASVWLTLCNLLLIAAEKRKPSSAPVKCAQAVMIMGRSNVDVTKVLSLASLALAIYEQPRSAKILASKAVHTYPNVSDGWVVLSYSLMNDRASNYPTEKILGIFNHIQRELSPTHELGEWLKRQKMLLK